MEYALEHGEPLLDASTESMNEQLELEAGQHGGAESNLEQTGRFLDPGISVLSLLKPVILTMVIVVYLAHALGPQAEIQGGFSQLMVYHERADDSTSTKLGGVLLNSVMMVAMLFVVTTFLLVLYKMKCYKVIYAWLVLSVAMLLLSFSGYVAASLVDLYGVLIDTPSFYLLLYNYSIVGTVLVFWTEFGFGPHPPKVVRQTYLVIISALLAWSATKLPEWSTWGVLAAVSVWDLIAVLTPQGPLKLLVEEAERRGDPIPGLVYDGDDIKLGLGDFVFYSILVGRASMRNVLTLISCALAVLTGLCATLALLPIMERVLPALPISIALGIGVYFTSSLLLTPLAEAAAGQAFFL